MKRSITLTAFSLLFIVGSANAQTIGTSPWTAPSSGTYEIPAGVTAIRIECWGGGGAGGGAGGSLNVTGRGGGGGAYARLNTLAVTPGQTLALTVGNGGAGASNANGGNGENSSVTYNSVTVVLAAGGAGGTRATGNNGGSTAGGSSSVSVGDVAFDGGNGGGGGFGGGGGGGGSAGNSGAGGIGGTGSAIEAGGTGGFGGAGGNIGGGDGGNGGSQPSTNGFPGSAPGGGGGGAKSIADNSTNRTGGAGATGRVVLTYCVLFAPGATTGPSAACGPATLGLETPPDATQTGIVYQWQSSTTGDVDADYSPTGGNAATYSATVAEPTWFRCRIECSATGAFVLSTALLVSPEPPNAGNDATLNICNTAPPEDMFLLLGPDAETGGSWSGPSPVSNGLFDPASMVGGAYVYTISGVAPCPNAVATVTVVIDPCLGVGEINGADGIRWLGQEADGTHQVETNGTTVTGWIVLDYAGRTIATNVSTLQGERVRIPLGTEPSGIYILALNTANGSIVLRFMHTSR
jgi:hypothetical protein